MRHFGPVYRRASRDGFYYRFRRGGGDVQRYGGRTEPRVVEDDDGSVYAIPHLGALHHRYPYPRAA